MTTVSVSFNKDVSGPYYTFKCPDDLSAKLFRGDAVLADTKFSIKIVYVAAVHKTPQLDPEATYEYKWVFQKVDFDLLAELKRGGTDG